MRPAFLAYLWAGPVSLVGLALAALARLTGGSTRVSHGALEASGGILRPLLARGIPRFSIDALTLGHVILGTGPEALEKWRRHERAHVAQFARLGVLFPFAYLAAGLLARSRGLPGYAGNRFERQAVLAETEGPPHAPAAPPADRPPVPPSGFAGN
jgi:hypothetical protein